MNDFRVPRAGAAGDATSPGEQSVRSLRILVWLSVALPLMLLALSSATNALGFAIAASIAH